MDLIQTEAFKTEALAMLWDLESNKVEITLLGPEGSNNRLRCVEGRSPEWYKSLFNRYHNGQRGKDSRSLVRRYKVVKALNNLSESKMYETVLYMELIELIHDRLLNGYEAEGYFIPPRFKGEV